MTWHFVVVFNSYEASVACVQRFAASPSPPPPLLLLLLLLLLRPEASLTRTPGMLCKTSTSPFLAALAQTFGAAVRPV